MLNRLSRIGDKTWKRELAAVFALVYLAGVVRAFFFADAETVAAQTPLLTGLAIPILGFVAAAAGIHYLKPKNPAGSE